MQHKLLFCYLTYIMLLH